MAVSPKEPRRSLKVLRTDLHSIEAHSYNDAAGAKKVILVKPPVKAPYVANTEVPVGSLIMVSAAGTITLSLINKDFNASNVYQKGDIAVNTGNIYLCMRDNVTGAFNADDWKLIGPSSVAGVPVNAGDVVSLGRWFNSINANGFLVDDDSFVSFARVRD